MSGFQPLSRVQRSPLLKLRLLTGPRAGRQLRVSDTKPVSIGRRKGRLRLHDSRVSKHHAEIYFASDVWVLRDMGSANGTYVNRKRVNGLIELEPGDLVQMGRVLFKIVRCDMIGMDTQPFSPEAAGDQDLLDSSLGLASPSSGDDDFDLEALFGDGRSSDPNDDSSAIEAIVQPETETAPKADARDGDQSDEPQDDITLEPMTIAFDQPVDDDDSFFGDLGEATDTSGGQDIAVNEALAKDDIEIEDEPAGAPMELTASASDAPRVEAEQAAETDDDDPFLPNESEEDSDDTGDLISLDDESGMGSRSSGTTLLTAAHDDGTPIDEVEVNDGIVLDQAEVEEASESEESADDFQDDQDQADGHEEDDEPPALVGLALEHTPPQQPQVSDEAETLAEAAPPVEEAVDSKIDQADEVVAKSIDEPVEAEADVELSDEHVGPVEVVEPIKPVAELPVDGAQADFDSEAEPVLSASADVEPEIDESEEDGDFDIDAAFDELSEGLDDSLSGSPAVQQDHADPAVQDAPADQADEPDEQPLAEASDALIGSQLDVDFIKDALSQMEDDLPASDPPREDAKPKSAAPQAEAVSAPPAAPAEPYLQSPPPGLTTSGINPTSLNPPTEPNRSYAPKRSGGGAGRWFFTLLLFLGIGGVGGWFISQNYEKFIGSRTADATGNDGTPPGPLADPGGGPAIPPSVPPIDPIDPVATDDTRDPETAGPNPFGSGPSVIGSEAVAGLTRDSSDARPLNPPRETSPSPTTGSDTIRKPNLPSVDGTDPTIKDPVNPPDPGPTRVPPTPDEPPAKIVFLVDASGSLVDSLPQMLVWLNQALQTVEQDEQFAVYFFKSDNPIAIKPAGLQTPSRQLLAKIAQDVLNADSVPVFPSGRSNPTHAIAKALSHEPTDIYLLSDDAFAFHQGDTTSKDALDLVKKALGDKDVRVHGVQFFYRSDQSILETLANEYDGTFEFVRENVVPNADPIDLLEELGGE